MGIKDNGRVYCLRREEDMQDKKSRYKGFLISGLVIALLPIFLLVRNATDIDAMEESITTPSSIKEVSDESKKTPDQFTPSKVSRHDVAGIEDDHQLGGSNGIEGTKDELKDVKTLPRLQFDLRLAGTVLVGKEYAYALIVEETTGRQNLYSVGESIKGAKLLKIDKESVVFEKEGRTHVLKITGGSYTVTTLSEILDENGPLFTGVSTELSFFEPVFSETGPPEDENVSVEELPPFEPITNNTGPPVDPEGLYEDLPEFIPFESDSGPPGM